MADDFERYGYAAAEGTTSQGGEALEEALKAVLQEVQDEHILLESHGNANWDAIDAVLGHCLTGIDMLYLERDDKPTTSVSGLHGSWVAEQAPWPCDMDAWLRAAIPEQPRTSFAMEQFLRRTVQPDRPQSGSRPSSRPGSSGSVGRRAGVHTPGSPATPSRASQAASPSPTKRVQSPLVRGGKAADERLREELEIRRSQVAIARSFEAKDAAEREKLKELRKTLKGRSYAYDHKGEIVVMSSGFVPTLDHGPAFRLAPAEEVETCKSPPRRNHVSAKDRKARQKDTTERKLVSDYCEAPGGSQPNALETVHVAAGVTLRGGSQSRSGPPRPRATAGTVGQGTGATMSREEFSRYLAQQEIKAARAKRVSSDTASRPSLRAVLPAAAGGTAKAEPGAAANGHAMPALFADLPDSEPATLGGTLRTAESKAEAGRLTSKVDVNPMLFGAADWGAPGTVASSSNGSSLTFAKPSDKQRALEVAQVGRMPRNRLTQPQLLGGTAR